MAVGTTLAFFLTPQYSSYSTISEDSLPLTPAGNRDLAKRMFALLHEKKMVMLIGILIYTGLQQAFIWCVELSLGRSSHMILLCKIFDVSSQRNHCLGKKTCSILRILIRTSVFTIGYL